MSAPRLRLRDTILINLAGQTITAIVPLGDLTRAAFASTADGTDFGTVAATVTVQELSYMLWLILSALPAILALGYGLAAVIPVAVGMALIVVDAHRLARVPEVPRPDRAHTLSQQAAPGNR